MIRAEREHCCDDVAVAAIRDRVVYVKALALLAESQISGMALAAAGMPLLLRIRRILGLADTSGGHRFSGIAGVALPLFMAMLLNQVYSSFPLRVLRLLRGDRF